MPDNMEDILNENALSAHLDTKWLGRRFHYFKTIDSTNTFLKSLVEEGEPSGSMVLADYQSKGKGRHGRRWEAPAGSSLLCSLLFRPDWPSRQAQWLTMMAGLSAVETLRFETGLDFRLKWPNDIVVGDHDLWRKCGGLLLEGEFDGPILRSAVLGIGINVNIPSTEISDSSQPVTSLQIETGQSFSRLPILTRFLLTMEAHYESASRGLSPQPAWRSLLVNIGKPVRVNMTGSAQPIIGVATDVDPWGRLLIRDGEGKIHVVSAGEVTLRS